MCFDVNQVVFLDLITIRNQMMHTRINLQRIFLPRNVSYEKVENVANMLETTATFENKLHANRFSVKMLPCRNIH